MNAWLNRAKAASAACGEEEPEKPETPPAVVRGDVTFSVATLRGWWQGKPARLFGIGFSVDVNGDADG